MNFSKKEWKKLMQKVPMIVVDGILIENDNVLLVERTTEPFLGHNVLPGGFVDYGERVKEAVIRETFEETGLRTKVMAFVGIYDNPKRDPRGRTISLAFLLKRTGGRIRESNETRNIRFFPLNKLPKRMGFDHKQMVADALKMMKKK